VFRARLSDTAVAPPLIAHIVFRFDYGGLENGVVNVVNGLGTTAYRHAIIALTEATPFRERLPKDVPVFALGKRPGKDFGAYVRLFRLLRELKPAVIHSRNIGTIDSLVVGFFAGVRLRIHGEHGWDVSDPDGSNRKYRAMRRALHVFAHAFVAVSDEIRQWLVGRVGIPPPKVKRICNGVDTAKFRPLEAGEQRLAPLAALGTSCVIVGSVTRFSAIKDPLNLVEAFLLLRANSSLGRRLRLAMIGDGDLHPAAARRLAEAGAADAAWLPGSRDDVAEILRGIDIFVLGSLREGISNTVLEAMASGLPVIATATGGNPELVENGTNGELIRPGDSQALAAAIERYAASDDLRSSHGRASRQRTLAEFSIAGMIEAYRRLYDDGLAAVNH
jgi:sugar transferase (PEP-CTERM/EpsH1 system associated)